MVHIHFEDLAVLSHSPYLMYTCSAGVGRTGTFITIDAMLERLQEKDNLNIYQFVTAMRTRRTFMVQTMVSECMYMKYIAKQHACSCTCAYI